MRHTLATKSTTTNDGAYARKAKEKIALPWKQSTTRILHETLQSRRDCNLCIHRKKKSRETTILGRSNYRHNDEKNVEKINDLGGGVARYQLLKKNLYFALTQTKYNRRNFNQKLNIFIEDKKNSQHFRINNTTFLPTQKKQQ